MVNTRTGLLLVTILVMPLIGSLNPPAVPDENTGLSDSVPEQSLVTWANPGPWWSWTSLDSDRNGIHDSIQSATGPVNVGVSFSRPVTDADRSTLEMLGHIITVELPSVNAVLIGPTDI